MKIKTRTLAFSAALASFSAVAQLFHIGYQSPTWGMWIDIVSVTWVLAFLLFGFQSALFVSLIGSLIITLFSPDTWLGASMKFIATIPIILSFFMWSAFKKQPLHWYANVKHLVLPLVIGIVIRCVIVIPLNYYYAIPIWTGMTPQAAIKVIPWFIIVGFNVVQSIVDVTLAWILAYRFHLRRYSV